MANATNSNDGIIRIEFIKIYKCWLQDELSMLIKKHYDEAIDEHMWATSQCDEELEAQHEQCAKDNWCYAKLLEQLRDSIK